MLRQHEVFQSPIAIDLGRSVTIDTPETWKDSIEEPTVNILPLVDDSQQNLPAGRCTYTYEHAQAPELEIICGGVNSKTPKASAIWRQGNLLHFGFEPSPAELNDTGQALLVNSICYIARFSEDRPIVRTPRAFRPLDRGAIDRLVSRADRNLDVYLDWFLSRATRKAVRGMKHDELAQWYRATGKYLHADRRGKFVVDKEAREFGVPPDSEEFIPALIAAWSKADAPDSIPRKLLLRYVAGGSGQNSRVEDWQAWWTKNERYLFFSDTGGFVWQVDPLSKKRGVPSQELRGIDRATKPVVELLKEN